MTFQSIITIVALIIAILNILPKYRRLEITVKFTWIDISLIILSVLAIHYLLFYNLFVSLNLNPALNLSRWGISPSNISYLIVIMTGVFIYIRFKYAALPKRKIYKFRELIEELSNQSKYSELFPLFEKNLNRLLKIHNSSFFLSKIRSALLKTINPSPGDFSDLSIEELEEIIGEELSLPKKNFFKKISCFLKKLYMRFISVISNLLPSYSSEKECVQDIFKITLLKQSFAQSMIKIKPYFAIEILKLDIFEKSEFKNNFFRELLRNTESILYFEIKNNQNFNSKHRYYIPDSNKLLSYLFHDVKNAEKLYVSGPIGEQIIDDLDELYKNEEFDKYNMPLESFDDEACWESSIFVGIRFFDIMVSEAIYQNIQWHMQLYYFRYFTQRICRNFNPNLTYVNLNDEFPTKYNYLLYEIFSTLRYWIGIIKEMPNNQDNLKLKSNDLTHENDNIIKSSIIALGECIRALISTESIPKRFKNDRLDMVFNLYLDLKSMQDKTDYAELVLLSLIYGGSEDRDIQEEHIGQVISSFLEYDSVPHTREHVEEAFEQLVRNYISNFPVEGLQKWGKLEIEDKDIILKSKGQGRGYRTKNQILVSEN